jgi:3-oxoacyl-(acyl-carrier-protein) synthase
MRRRVKITGIGPVTPAGIGREAFFKGINEPVSRVRALPNITTDTGPIIGADIPDFRFQDYAPDKNPRRHSRHTQLGLAAAVLAMRDANLTPEMVHGLNRVVVTGTSLMDFERIHREINTVSQKGSRFALASNLYESSLVNVPGKIAEMLGPDTRMFSMQSSCCSGLDAIGQAADLIADGQADLAIAGGTESPLSFHPMVEFIVAGLSPTSSEAPGQTCKPFDLWRSTGVIGEGAAMLILEPEESPRPAYAWITGYGYANDGEGLAASGIKQAARLALANARRRPEQVDFISAWGPGHRIIDEVEAVSLKEVFEQNLAEIPVASIKGAIGTALAAAGAIQVASTALGMARRILPPTVNWSSPDPACSLNLAAVPRYMEAKIALVDSHGMSGSNAVVVVEKT